MSMIKNALLGDKEAQKNITENGIILPCPRCHSKDIEIEKNDIGFYNEDTKKWEKFENLERVYIECKNCYYKGNKLEIEKDLEFEKYGKKLLNEWNNRPNKKEIIFKAKRKDNYEWVVGYPFPSISGKELNRMTVFENIEGKMVANTYEIYTATICQYTGLKDKNGNMIFEGDIITYKTYYYGNESENKEVVIFDNDIENDSFGEPLTMGYVFRSYENEIVGNIYDLEEMERLEEME